jgi:hypothetical protein
MSEARQRAKRRRSPWNLLLVLIVIIVSGGVIYVSAQALLAIQRCLISDDAIFWSYTTIGGTLMFIPLIILSFGIGMMITNLIMWLIRPARMAFDKEAIGIKGASFSEAMKGLATLTFIILIITIPLNVFGVLNCFYITSDGVQIRPLFSIKENRYAWGDIEQITTRCLEKRDKIYLNYVLRMKDGRDIDLMRERRLEFVDAYDKIKPFLAAQSQIKYDCQITDGDIAALKKHYFQGKYDKIISILRCEK